MNWLLIIVVIFLAFCIMNGYRKGFLRMMYSMVSWIIMLVFVAWATPYVNNYLTENTSLYQTIEAYCEDTIREKAQAQAEEGAQSVIEEQSKTLMGAGVMLPDSVLNSITQKTAGLAGDMIESNGIYEQVSSEIADFILNGISSFIALALAMIILHFISRVLRVVSKIPVIRGINRYLGTAAGAIYGMMIVWIGFYLIAICSTSEIGTALTTYIYESPFLTYIYENNLVVTLVLMYL